MRSNLLAYVVDAVLGLVLGFLTGVMFYMAVTDPSWLMAGVTGLVLYTTCYHLLRTIARRLTGDS